MQFKGSLMCIVVLLTYWSASGSNGDSRNTSDHGSGSDNTKETSDPQSEYALHSQSFTDASNLTIFLCEAGADNPDCIHGDKANPCRTIEHAYNEAMIQITNATKHISFVFMDKRYELNEALILNREAKFVKIIEFTSTVRTTIIGMNEESVVWVGCNTTATIPCISYDVEFNNLSFMHFVGKLPAVVVVFNINYLYLHDCSFCHNNRSAINLLDTSVVLNNIDFSTNNGNTKFKDIRMERVAGFPSSNFSNGGAVAFVFRGGHGKFVNISSCSFTSNNAVQDSVFPYTMDAPTDTQFERDGGAALVLFIGNCTGVRVAFVTSTFVGNAAYSGGAVAIVTEFNASANTVTFTNCKFFNNTARLSAGAIIFGAFDFAGKNLLVIIDCMIMYNRAKYASALKFMNNGKRRSLMGSTIFGLEVIRTKLCRNIAESGSAVHISVIDRQSVNTAKIFDSLFDENDSTGDKESYVTPRYRAAIATYNIDVIFVGNNEIKDNKALRGLFVSSSSIHVNGTLKIARNVATYSGGGMMLVDASHLILYPGSHMRLEGNRANGVGGALAVSSTLIPNITYVYNPYCFLQYSIPNQPYSKWNTKVEFISNSAGLSGGAIYISTLTTCLWMEDPPYYSFEKAFRWNDKFVYNGNCAAITKDCNSSGVADIATDTYNLVLHNPKQVKTAPGEKISLKLSSYDELKSSKISVAFVSYRAFSRKDGREMQSQLNTQNPTVVLNPFEKNGSVKTVYEVSSLHYKGITNENVKHEIMFWEIMSSSIIIANLNITPIYCRPGYVYHGKRCKCDLSQTFIASCKGTKIALHGTLWATSSNGKLSTFPCPPNYCKCTQYSNPGECIYDSLHSESQCSRNRMGVLCGACKGRCDNITYGVSLDDGECIECDSKSITKATVLLVLLTVGVLCVALLIVYLNPTISTKMRGPMFYVQMIPYYYTGKSSWGTIVRNTASLLALGGSSHLPISGCLGNDWNRIDIIALKYIFPVIILTVLVTIYILSRCLLIRFKRNSPFESLWLLLIAMYCLFCETSIILFYCVDVNGKWVFFYDGTVECFHGKHLVMVIVSSIVLVLFVIVPPVVVFLISTGRSNAPLAVMDALCKGLKLRFRWWWAVDLSRRLAFAASFVFKRQSWPTFSALCIIILTLHTACQPYKDTFANMSETYLLFSMSIIAPLHNALARDASDKVMTAIIAANLMYIIILFLYLVACFIKRRFNRSFGSFFRCNEERRIPIPYRIIEAEREDNSST